MRAVPSTGAAPQVEIWVDGGEFSLVDRSVSPQVRMAMKSYGGTIGAMSSQNIARADVALRATVDGVGPVAITGQLDPLGAPRFMDPKMEFKNVDLLPPSPYSGKFAGYELAASMRWTSRRRGKARSCDRKSW